MTMGPLSQQVLSAAEDPAAANRLADEILGNGADQFVEPKEITPPPDTSITLTGGFLDLSSGQVLMDATVREMTGEDEEVLAGINLAEKPVQFYDTLLDRCVDTIGPREATKSILSGLYIGDREMLVVGIRKATYGPTFDMNYRCPECRDSNMLTFDVDDDIIVKRLEDPSKRVREVELRNGVVATLGFPTGDDQRAVYGPGLVKTNVAELNTAMLSRVVQTIDGRMVNQNKAVVRSLNSKDRRTLVDFLFAEAPGPRLQEVRVPCPSCSRENEMRLDLADLLFA